MTEEKQEQGPALLLGLDGCIVHSHVNSNKIQIIDQFLDLLHQYLTRLVLPLFPRENSSKIRFVAVLLQGIRGCS